jgi:hypothetical protein
MSSSKFPVLILLTEGESSEPNFLKEYIATQTSEPLEKQTLPPIIIPIEGNITNIPNIIERCNQKIADSKELNEIKEMFGNEIKFDKYLIIDFDTMTDEQYIKLIEDCKNLKHTLIVSKPNFEFFILSMLIGVDNAQNIKPSEYIHKIDNEIKYLWQKFKITHSNKIPYQKNKIVSLKFFSSIFTYFPNIVNEASNLNFNKKNKNWSDMPKLLIKLNKLYNKKIK